MTDRGSSGKSERTTVRPPFDPEAFARESDSKVRDATLPPSARPTVPPATPSPTAAPAEATSVPSLAIARDDLEWFDVSPFARELLRHVNGQDSVGEIARLAGCTANEVARELSLLAGEGLVTWR